MFFGILERDQEIEAFKAIVSLNEAYPETSLAEICWIKDPLKKVAVGDRLTRLDEIPSLDGDDPAAELQDRDLPIPLGDQGLLTLPDFLRSFHQGHSTWSLFWMALLQIQDWEIKGDLLGRVERQLLFQQVAQLIKTQTSGPGASGPLQPGHPHPGATSGTPPFRPAPTPVYSGRGPREIEPEADHWSGGFSPGRL